MLLRGNRFLDSAKIQSLVQTLADQLDMNQNLWFLNKTEIVDADDEDIVGKWKGQVYAADIIADDQKAVVYESGSFEFVTNSIPNLKVGQRVNQSMLNRLMRMSRNLGQSNDVKFFTDWENTLAENLVEGVRQRVNALICAMHMDSFTYDRLGVKLSGVGWGMPSDLKVTVGTDWSDTTNATPITDIQVVAVDTAPDTYGEQFDYVVMSSRAFKYVTQNAEFQNRIKGELRYNFGTGQINVRDTGAMKQLLSNILGMDIIIYDATYWTRANNGAKTRERVLPYNKVIFGSNADNNNRNAMDFANGIVTESVVGSFTNEEGFSGEAFGPISYYTSEENLNPPSITAWSVLRGFPRKHRETCTAVLTVGSGNNWA